LRREGRRRQAIEPSRGQMGRGLQKEESRKRKAERGKQKEESRKRKAERGKQKEGERFLSARPGAQKPCAGKSQVAPLGMTGSEFRTQRGSSREMRGMGRRSSEEEKRDSSLAKGARRWGGGPLYAGRRSRPSGSVRGKQERKGKKKSACKLVVGLVSSKETLEGKPSQG
jgi:hypothetical protein